MQVVALGENNTNSLNEVRPRRPEQYALAWSTAGAELSQ